MACKPQKRLPVVPHVGGEGRGELPGLRHRGKFLKGNPSGPGGLPLLEPHPAQVHVHAHPIVPAQIGPAAGTAQEGDLSLGDGDAGLLTELPDHPVDGRLPRLYMACGIFPFSRGVPFLQTPAGQKDPAPFVHNPHAHRHPVLLRAQGRLFVPDSAGLVAVLVVYVDQFHFPVPYLS